MLILVYGTGCSTSKSILKKITRRVRGGEASLPNLVPWSEVEDKRGRLPVNAHPFFSFSPRENLETGLAHYVLTTPPGSPYRYDLHLATGNLHRSKRYCKQKDVWKGHKSSLTRPSYGEGFIPRLIDSQGFPQKIIVFGLDPIHPFDYSRFKRTRPVKIVGGVLEQYCRRYPCSKNKTWESRMVLVAINPLSQDFRGVKTLKRLKKVINWSYAKSFLENSGGRTLSFYDETEKKGDLPAYRIVKEFEGRAALKYVLKTGHLFKEKDILLMKKSCDKLYGHLWGVSKFFKRQKKAGKKGKDFSSFFEDFFKNYGKSYDTCSRFMGSTRGLKNMGKIWFYSFFDAVFHVHKLGYVYDCQKKVWVRFSDHRDKADKRGGQRVLFLEKNLCQKDFFNEAFDAAVSTLGILNSNSDHSYRYKTYDFGSGGTHQRIYSWIYDSGKKILCVNDDDQLSQEETRSAFPNDVRWTPL